MTANSQDKLLENSLLLKIAELQKQIDGLRQPQFVYRVSNANNANAGDLNLTGSFQDIPGVSISLAPTADARYILFARVVVDSTAGAANDEIEVAMATTGSVTIGGGDQNWYCIVPTHARQNSIQIATTNITLSGTGSLKLQAKNNTASRCTVVDYGVGSYSTWMQLLAFRQ
jgi:hypothetical protein